MREREEREGKRGGRGEREGMKEMVRERERENRYIEFRFEN